jgi:enoyl-[acyl-carrier protein] reductase II
MTNLHQLWARGAECLGTEQAMMGGAMSWVSERHLVSALSNAGEFGVIAASSMPQELLDKEIKATQGLTQKPFGVNLIIMHPQLAELVEICIANKVSHVVLAGGVPKGPTISRLKEGGCKVICFAPTAALGKKLVKMGADALVIEGSEAGGHIGPVSTSVLAQEILPVITDVPVFVAGGIGRGNAIAAYLEMGASGVQLGTRFAAAAESVAHDKFKAAFVRASARDALSSVQIDPRLPVIPVRALKNAGSEAFNERQREVAAAVDRGEMDLAAGQLAIEHYWAGALRRAVIDGDVEHGSVMAGQSVGMVTKEEPLADIIASLMAEAAQALEQRAA